MNSQDEFTTPPTKKNKNEKTDEEIIAVKKNYSGERSRILPLAAGGQGRIGEPKGLIFWVPLTDYVR